MTRYTPAMIVLAIDAERSRLFFSWSVGRPEGWSCDRRTEDIVCVSVWLDEELRRLGVDDLGRKTQLWQFNRYSRSDDDIFVLAAQVMNDAVDGNNDRDRKTHRRWG